MIYMNREGALALKKVDRSAWVVVTAMLCADEAAHKVTHETPTYRMTLADLAKYEVVRAAEGEALAIAARELDGVAGALFFDDALYITLWSDAIVMTGRDAE